jgi:hypothetical protein
MELDIKYDIDAGIDPLETIVVPEPDIIPNPFFAHRKIIDIHNNEIYPHELTVRKLFLNYNKLLILCLESNEVINDDIFSMNISPNYIRSLSNKLVLIKGTIKMLRNPKHRDNIIDVDKKYIEMFNKYNIDLDEHELLLPILNISEKDIMIYIKQFTGIFDITDLFKLRTMNDYFCDEKTSLIVKENIITTIRSMIETCYWTLRYNCQLNITIKFMDRGFYINSQRIEDKNIKEIIEKINDIPEGGNNYLQFIYRKKNFVDAASNIRKDGYTLYHPYNVKSDDITVDDINMLFDSLSSKKEFYYFLTSLMVSKEYCHLIVNNKYLLKKLYNKNLFNKKNDPNNKSILERYIPIIKYLLGYTWITMYIEESIKKSRVTEKDRIIFDIDTAHLLPYFPYDAYEPHLNPYLTILVKEQVLDSKNNIIGLPCVSTTLNNNRIRNGITTLDEFRRRVNLFTTGNQDNNIFNGMNWKNIAICGSIMPACVQERSHLMSLFEDPINPNENEAFIRFCDEYYVSSDIDVVIIHESWFDFFDKSYEFLDVITNNLIDIETKKLGSNNTEVTIDSQETIQLVKNSMNVNIVKTAAVMVNEKYIKNNILESALEKDAKYTYEYIKAHINDDDIKDLFYEIYKNYKMNDNEKYIDKNDSKLYGQWTNEHYTEIFDIISKNDMLVILIKTKEEWDKERQERESSLQLDKKTTDEINVLFKEENDEDVEFVTEYPILDEFEDEFSDNIEEVCTIHEGYKFKISSKYLKHPFELFKTKYPSIWSMISRFHLPCVRSYYDGNNVYMLPSCVTAMMTNINTDYKYFAGAKDPIEIINKYRTRGFGVYLNDMEKIHLIEYSRNVTKWNNLYGINIKNSQTIVNVFGYKTLDDKIYKPRRFNSEFYTDYPHVSDNYQNCSNLVYLTNQQLVDNEYRHIYGYDNSMHSSPVKLESLYSINDKGYINPLKKWIIDAGYDLC